MILSEWVQTEKEDLHKIIRKKRNNVLKTITEHHKELPFYALIELNEYKTLLDTIDYILDKGGRSQDD